MIAWLNERYGANLVEAELNEIRDFMLLWGIYEGSLFQNSFTIDRLVQEVEGRNPNAKTIEQVFAYLQNRYVTEEGTNERFNYLNLRKSDRPGFVKEVLLAKDNSLKAMTIVTGIVIYRFRSNLFHGLKNVAELRGQVDNFRHANMFLRAFLET
jgi:hypothetical protein